MESLDAFEGTNKLTCWIFQSMGVVYVSIYLGPILMLSSKILNVQDSYFCNFVP
jgi:hypothetical protein